MAMSLSSQKGLILVEFDGPGVFGELNVCRVTAFHHAAITPVGESFGQVVVLAVLSKGNRAAKEENESK